MDMSASSRVATLRVLHGDISDKQKTAIQAHPARIISRWSKPMRGLSRFQAAPKTMIRTTIRAAVAKE